MGNFVSFGAGVILLIVSMMVMLAYWPRLGWFGTGSGTLGMAIFLGFLAAAANAFYWQIFGNFVVSFDLVSLANVRSFGHYLDGLLKGSAATAGVLHLMAIQRNLPEEERRTWHWYQMPWYPKRRACLELIVNMLLWKRDRK